MCEGLCDVSGQNCNAFGNMCTDSSCQGPIDNSILVSQQLKDDFNATIFTVGFGPVGTCTNATQLLQRIADITNGTYQHSDNPDELRNIYINISTEILESLTLTSQKVTVPGAAIPSKLHGDSYLLAVHDKSADVFPNQIEITRQTPPFGICNPVVNFPSEVTVLSAQLVSYSAEHWTDYVSVNDQEAFNLSNYFVDYTRLGDPFLVHIPRANITDSNQFYFRTGDAPDNFTGCSPDNSLVYTLLVPSATPRTTVFANATGCVWTIENDDGTFQAYLENQIY